MNKIKVAHYRKMNEPNLEHALIRWSVVHRQWHELANDCPQLSGFLCGWFWRVGGNLHPPAVIEGFRDSFRVGFREADTAISIYEQSQRP